MHKNESSKKNVIAIMFINLVIIFVTILVLKLEYLINLFFIFKLILSSTPLFINFFKSCSFSQVFPKRSILECKRKSPQRRILKYKRKSTKRSILKCKMELTQRSILKCKMELTQRSILKCKRKFTKRNVPKCKV